MKRLVLLALLTLTACTNGSFTAISSTAPNGSQSNDSSDTGSDTGTEGGDSTTPPATTPTTPTNPTTPSTPTAKKILFGVNGHDGRVAYPLSQSEAVFKLLDSKNLRTYRVDIVPTVNPNPVMETLIPLAKKYNIKLRPMIYPTTKAVAYNFAKNLRW